VCGVQIAASTCPSCGAEIVPAPDVRRDDRSASAHDQTAGERDQTASDRDQTSSDHDQTSSDRDQTSSDSDQRSSNEDQNAADHDHAAGSDQATYERTTQARDHATDERRATSHERDETGRSRQRTASERDRAAELRDLEADKRDATARAHDLEDDEDASWDDTRSRAARDRERAAVDRARASEDRALAAYDRDEAARERADALRIHTESAALLNEAGTDELTGARTRYLGLDEASREFERAGRTGSQLLLAYVDVDSLTRLNDTHGERAGDALLRLVGETLRTNLRPYDVIVRYGDNEFLCAMPNLNAPEARARFQKITQTLAAVDTHNSLSFGLAQADPAEDLNALITRAHADLLKIRHARANTS
jgi:diguanylate cyclase (GGDEF)-like protein